MIGRLLLFSTVLFGTCVLMGQQASDGAIPRPEALLRKTVAFITVKYRNGHETWTGQGTGFFVYVEDSRLGANRGFTYLVTNRHVAEPRENGVAFPVLATTVRMSIKVPQEGKRFKEEPLPLSSSAHWYFPRDEAVDLAVLPITPDESVYDFRAIPLSLFATTETFTSNGISEGARILFTGLFVHFVGISENEPIVREGTLAMIPDGPMPTTLAKPGRVYLGDVHVMGGNSGSPVFVDITGFSGRTIRVAEYPYRFLGVVAGYMYEDEQLTLRVATNFRGTLKANSGISMIVPADQLQALLKGPELQKTRDDYVASGGHR